MLNTFQAQIVRLLLFGRLLFAEPVHMAFASGATLMMCGVCKDFYKYHQMWDSQFSPEVDDGPANMLVDPETVRNVKKLRICASCEMQFRESIAMDSRPSDDYCEEAVVKRDMKRLGEYPSKWPTAGCGARFIHWGKGCSKVVEMRN